MSKGNEFCCDKIRKVRLSVTGINTQEQCGVPDSLLEELDHPLWEDTYFMRYCPFCGMQNEHTSPGGVARDPRKFLIGNIGAALEGMEQEGHIDLKGYKPVVLIMPGRNYGFGLKPPEESNGKQT